MRLSKLVALSATGAFAVSLAGCGGGGGPSGKDSSGGNSSNVVNNNQAATQGQDATAKGPAPAVAGAKKGGALNVTESSAPPTLDPSGIYYTDSNSLAGTLLYRTLTQYKLVGGKPVLVPDLATNVGTPSADGLTWSFKLKQGIKYSDGSPVNIQDYVYAVKRSFAVESVAANGTQYQMEFLKGGDTYKGPFKQPTAAFPGVTTQGNDTLVFHMTKKFPSFNFFTTFPEFSPIPQSKDKQPNNYQLHPVTTGPYKVDSYTKGQKLTLSKNTNWDPNSDPSRHQFPDSITVTFNRDEKQAQTQILSNSGAGASTVDFSPGLDASLINQVKTPQGKKQFVQGPSACTYFVQLDTRKIPLDVRKAIAIAYPYNQIRKAAGIASINIQPATSFASPSLQGYKKYPAVNGATGQGNGDPAKAKAMLQKIGKSGFQLSFYHRNDTPQRVASGNAEKAGLEAAGFKVKIISTSGEQYSTDIANPKAPVNMGQGPNGWCYDWPTGDSVYPPLFNGAGIPQGTTVGQFKDPVINKKMLALQALPVKQAAAGWAALDKELMTNYLPSLPDYHIINDAVYGNKLHNVQLNPIFGAPSFSDIWVG